MKGICTTKDQSRTLIELGLSPETADMWYIFGGGDFPEFMKASELDLPAWSLSALLELMPQTIDNDDKWLLRMERCYQRFTPKFICRYPYSKSTGICRRPLDAAFEMVVWLLKEKKL